MKEKKVNIIGGGIAGMTLALTLQKLNIPYQLYEKNDHLTYDNVGIGISENILPLLNSLDLLDQTVRSGAFINKFHFLNTKGKRLNTFQLKNPALSINRKTLYKILEKQLDSNQLFLNTQPDVSDFSKNEIIVHANGMQSELRKELYPELELRDSNQVLWRGISAINLPKKYLNAYHDYVGRNLRFAIIDAGKGKYSWYLIKDQKDQTLNQEDLEAIVLKGPYLFREIVGNTEEVFFSRLKDINPGERSNLKWYAENNIMIGDAIHPTTPNMANGACLAMEDAYLLGNLIHQHDNNKSAFELFQLEREGKVNQIVNQSWLFGKSLHWENPLMTWLSEQTIKGTPQFVFDKIYSNVLDKGTLLPLIYKSELKE